MGQHGWNFSSRSVLPGPGLKEENIKGTKKQQHGQRKDDRKPKMPRNKKKKESESNAVVKPTLEMELTTFKAIVRHITKHETSQHQARWFTMEARCELWWLAKLGITGHQPAIATYCKVNEEERQDVTEAILKQKVGSNSKAENV